VSATFPRPSREDLSLRSATRRTSCSPYGRVCNPTRRSSDGDTESHVPRLPLLYQALSATVAHHSSVLTRSAVGGGGCGHAGGTYVVQWRSRVSLLISFTKRRDRSCVWVTRRWGSRAPTRLNTDNGRGITSTVGVSGAWWVTRSAADGVGAVPHAPVKKCRILEYPAADVPVLPGGVAWPFRPFSLSFSSSGAGFSPFWVGASV
jgi:hypothetical protein